MMQFRWLIRAILATLLGSAIPSGAQDLEVQTEFQFERILDGQPAPDAQHLWGRIVRSDFELSSQAGHRHAYFEFCAFINETASRAGQLWRATLEDDGTRRILLLHDLENQCTGLRTDADVLMVNDTGGWERYKHNGWSFVADENHLGNPSEDSNVPHEGRGFIKLSLGPYLSARGRSITKTTTWDDATRTLVATKPKDGTVTVRFRTPHDQRRFGTILAELIGQTNDGARILYWGFIVDRESPLRLNITDIDSLPQRLRAVAMPQESEPTYVPKIDSQAEREAVRSLNAEFGFLKCDDVRDTKNPIFSTRFEGELIAQLFEYDKKVAPVLRSGGRMENFEVVTKALVAELEVAYPLIQAAVTKGDVDSLVDDPNMIWLAFERAMHTRYAGLVFSGLFLEPLEFENVPFLAKIKACMAMGEFGAPIWTTVLPPRTDPRGLFLQAILHARWNWLPTDEEVALCHAKLNEFDASRLEKDAAVDCLIRWGKLKDVPDYRMDVWFKSKLTATPTHRHCTWKALTRTPDGRQFLRERLESLASTPEIQRDIAAMLCCRASATLDMQRFDFMTEDECRETLRQCQPLAGAEVQKAKFTPVE